MVIAGCTRASISRRGTGSPIVAAADGRVAYAGWHGGYGQQVAIAHADGVRTTYGHMSRIAAAAGTYVRRGQTIGYVESTGLSTGPHVHFEVTRNGRPVNPLSAKLAGGPGHLQGEQLRAFQTSFAGSCWLRRRADLQGHLSPEFDLVRFKTSGSSVASAWPGNRTVPMVYSFSIAAC